MPQLQKLLDERYPLDGFEDPHVRTNIEEARKYLTEGYNAAIDVGIDSFELRSILKSCWDAARHWQNGSSDKNFNDFLETIKPPNNG